VAAVRTANFHGKKKRMGRYIGRRADWKKAFVTLKPGEKTIEFFENV
jgi:large subunit ribosomal protein L23